MSQRIESLEVQPSTVGIWTPWGEQKVLRSDACFLAQRAAARSQGGDDTSPAHGVAADRTLGRG